MTATSLPRNSTGATTGPEMNRGPRAELRATLQAQRDAVSGELVSALSGERYLNLLDRLDAAARRHHSWTGRRSSPAGLFEPASPPGSVLPELGGLEWRALRRKLGKLGCHPTDHELHRTRIRAKQLRYAAEAAGPVMGRPARRTAAAGRGPPDGAG